MSTESPLPRWRTYLRGAAADYRNAVLVTLALLVFSGHAMWQAYRAAWQEAALDLQSLHAGQAAQIGNWVNERRGDMLNLSRAIDSLMAHEPRCASPQSPCAVHLNELLTGFRSNGGFESLWLSDSSGRFQWTSGLTPGEVGLDAVEETQSDSQRQSNRSWVGFRRDAHGHPIGWFFQKLNHGGLGTLVSRFDTTPELFRVLSHWPSHRRRGEALFARLKDGQGVRVAPNGSGGLRVDDIGEHGAHTVLGQLKSGAATAGAAFEATDFYGVTVLAVGNRVSGSEWWLVVKQDRSAVLGEALPAMTQVGLAGLLGIGLTWGLLALQRQRLKLQAAGALAQERQERLRALDLLTGMANNSDDIIFAKDLEFRYLLFNPAAERHSGLTERQVLGHTDTELLPAARAQVFLAQDLEVLASGHPRHWNVEVEEDQPRVLSVVKSPLRDSEGKVRGLFCIARDITEVKRSEEHLRKLSLALEQSPVSVLITDPTGTIEYVNAAFSQSSGYSADEALGRNANLLASGLNARADYVAMWAALHRGEPWEGQLKNRHKNGSIYTDQVAIFPLRQPDGRVSHYVGLQQDVTEQLALQGELKQHRDHLEDLVSKRTEELAEATHRAEAANASKSAFLANMSHEIRTPMNAVLGSATLMLRDLRTLQGAVPSDTLGQMLTRVQQVEQSARHLQGLLNDLLDLSRIEANRLTLVRADFALRPLIDELFGMLGEQAKAHNVQLRLELDGMPSTLHGDAMRLRQILLNYLSNAVRFSENGRVVLRAHADKLDDDSVRVRFEVEDQGIGISDEQQARLFMAYEQAEVDTAHRFGGSGLGLAITRRLAELMGGEVGLRSQLGIGSCFWVELPFRLARHPVNQPTTAQSYETSLQRLQACGSRHVLLVDDVAINREIARDLLLDAGLRVTEAADGEEAIALAQKVQFDLVLMDLRMPRMGGIEATRKLREIPGYAETPVVALTAQAFDEDRQAASQAGMNDHLGKPVLPEQLYSCLSRWLVPSVAASAPPVAATAVGSAKDEPALPSALLTFAGLDLGVARRLLGRRLGRLPALLARFGREQGDAAQRIDQAVERGDLETATRIAHSLKGTAASLGLNDISELAARVEQTLHLGEREDLIRLQERLAADAPCLVALEQ